MNNYISSITFKAKNPNEKIISKMWTNHIPSKSEYIQTKINQNKNINSSKNTVLYVIKNCRHSEQVKIAQIAYDKYITSLRNKYAKEYEKLIVNTKYENPLYRNLKNIYLSIKEKFHKFI